MPYGKAIDSWKEERKADAWKSLMLWKPPVIAKIVLKVVMTYIGEINQWQKRRQNSNFDVLLLSTQSLDLVFQASENFTIIYILNKKLKHILNI
jgi:hypothetical protein